MISLHDPLANGKTNAAAGIFVVCVKTFKETEDALLELRLYSDPVIGDRKAPTSIFPLCSNLNFGRDILPSGICIALLIRF